MLLYNVKFQYLKTEWRTEISVYIYRIFIYVSNWFLHRSFRWNTRLFFGRAFYPREKNVIFADHVRMLKFVYRISPRNERHCKARRKQNTLQRIIVRLARITSCRCPLDGLKPVDSNYEIVHRGDCDCDFKLNATRHPTRHSRADIVSLVESRFRTMRYAGFVRYISLHCPQMQIYCYVDAYIISSVRGDIFIWHTANQ